jgi:hypothetical protein
MYKRMMVSEGAMRAVRRLVLESVDAVQAQHVTPVISIYCIIAA